MIDIIILLYVLLACSLIALIFALVRLCKTRVWIQARNHASQVMTTIGYVKAYGKDESAEVYNLEGESKAAIGKIITDPTSPRLRGNVEVLMTSQEDDAAKPRYRRAGYVSFDQTTVVDEYGYIFKQIAGKKEREMIGYLACPSKPHTPTLHGERTWKTLWLRCTLCAYAGMPNPELDKKENKKSKKDKDQSAQATPSEATTSPTEQTQAAEATPVLRLAGRKKTQEPAAEPVELPAEELIQTEEPVVEPVQEVVVTEEPVVEPIVEEPAVAEEVVEEPIEEPIEEAVEEETTVPAEEPVEEPVVEEPAVDPFATLEASVKAQLDSLREQQPSLVSAIFADMVHVKGGHFTMGSDPQPVNDILDQDGKTRGMIEQNESPKHEVSLQDYYIGKYPVTQKLWTLIMGENPSDTKDDNFPVAPVNWFQAQEFILRVSYLTGVMFHMPTEAQWEYAARGGEKSQGTVFAGSNTFSEVGWSDYKHAVGTKKPNELGIYDMSGLVREWCSDLWGHYSEDLQIDPTGPAEDSPLIILNTEGRLCRAVRSPYGNETVTNRKGETPDLDKEFKSYGVRIACYDIPKQEEKEQANPAPVTPPKSTPRPLDTHKEPVMMAKCYYTGFYRSRKDALPPEARACAYAMLHKYGFKQRASETSGTQPYGWRDTALLSSAVYAVLFLLLYIINTGIYQFPLVGEDILMALILTLFYFVIWAIIRYIKVDAIEQGASFQPQLDMFNKNLRVKWMNISILVLAVMATLFGLLGNDVFRDFDFLPLVWAIAIGTIINMTLSYANRKWVVKTDVSSANDDEDEDEELDEVPNPTGDIIRTYDWDLDSEYAAGKQLHGTLTLYFSDNQMKDVRHLNPFFSQRADLKDNVCIMEMFHFLKEHKTYLARTKYVASEIKKIANKNHLSPLDLIQFTLDFVQDPNITFQANRENKQINHFDAYIRYPDETLYDKVGDYNSKALLAAMLFHCMKYNVLYLISRKHQHAAVGVEIKKSDLQNGFYGNAAALENNLITYNNHLYIFCETTADHFVLGSPYKGMTIDEFDEKILLSLSEDDVDEQLEETLDDIQNRIYIWDLDSDTGNKLHGNFVIDFSQNEVDHLREINPFRTYGKDQHSYEDNIRSIFAYLDSDPNHTKHLRALAEYINTTVTTAGLTDLDKYQFALDFVQEPNIHYCVDEQSASIEFAKEYMRIPDETLFDKEGDCDCKSALATALFRAMGKNVLYLISVKLGHAAVAIECNDQWLEIIKPNDVDQVVCEHEGKRFIICETTGDGYRIGHLKDSESIQDFETKIYLPL